MLDSHSNGVAQELVDTAFAADGTELSDVVVKALERKVYRREAAASASNWAPALVAAAKTREGWILCKALGVIQESYRAAATRLRIPYATLFKRVMRVQFEIKKQPA